MIHYNSLDVKVSNSQLNKVKIATKNATEVTLKLSTVKLAILIIKFST